MRNNLILARAANGVIGLDGVMPWHLPEDMVHFKQQTMGAPVIMGRKTWDSIPPRFRPLPGRRNIVVTRNGGWQAEGAERAGSLEEAIALCRQAEAAEAWVIGGAQIYAEAEPLAQRVLLTEIEKNYDGDAWAPEFGAAWRQTARESQVAANGIPFSFVTLERG